jgi:hypothetical protein
MPPVTITEKWIHGFVNNADGTPQYPGTVTATLSQRIINDTLNLVIEDDVVVSANTDGDGHWAMALHPNNQPGDAPLNTHWLIQEPDLSTEPQIIFIPYDLAGGGTEATAIKYTSLITPPEDEVAPGVISALTDRVSALEDLAEAMNELDTDFLEGLSPAMSTDLLDAATAASAVATSTTPGLQSAANFILNASLATGQTNDVANMVRKDASGIIVPTNADPSNTGLTGRLYQSLTSGAINLQLGLPSQRTQITPGLISPNWYVASDVTVSATTYVTLASFPVAVNGNYYIVGPVFMNADAAVDLRCRFADVPAGATLRWFRVGISAANTATDGIGSTDASIATGNEALVFGGQGTGKNLGVQILGSIQVGATAGTVTFQAQKGTTGTNCTILTGTELNFLKQR